MTHVASLNHSSLDKGQFVLYQPNPKRQILLYDMATSSSVFTFLKMKDIDTSIRNLPNTEFMSENGKLPVVIERGFNRPMCGFNEVFRRVTRKFNDEPTLLELSYMDWIESKFLEAEMYLCWCYEPVLNDYTYARYTYDLPWPASTVLFHKKRHQMQQTVGSRFENFDDCLEKFNHFLSQLNKKIGNGPYIFGETPTCVDALIYGHTNAIESTSLNPRFLNAVNGQRRIEKLKDLLNSTYPS